MLERLKQKLTPKQLKQRERAFEQAARFVERAAANGGCRAPIPSKSWPTPPLPGGERVDLEIHAGIAFVPDADDAEVPHD
jgi:hypothetical protein